MTSNMAQVQIGNGFLPKSLRERKLAWMEKQMEKIQEKAVKVGEKVP
jgi:hypothetical protein